MVPTTFGNNKQTNGRDARQPWLSWGTARPGARTKANVARAKANLVRRGSRVVAIRDSKNGDYSKGDTGTCAKTFFSRVWTVWDHSGRRTATSTRIPVLAESPSGEAAIAEKQALSMVQQARGQKKQRSLAGASAADAADQFVPRSVLRIGFMDHRPALKKMLEPAQKKQQTTMLCPIMDDDYPAWQMHSCTNCNAAVQWSCEALVGYYSSKLNDRLVPRCPMTPLCNLPINQQMLAKVHGTYAEAQRNAREVVEYSLPAMRQKLAQVLNAAQQQAETAMRDAIIAIAGAKRCPGNGCDTVRVPASAQPHCKERFECGDCGNVGCIGCGESLYHYGCECAEVIPTTAEWHGWLEGGLHECLTHLAETDAQFDAARQRAEQKHSAGIAASIATHKQFQADEQWKAAHCKLCPHCGRTVQKTGGCNAMRCGRNTEGDPNQQDGCGKSFNFTQAASYVANAGARPTTKAAAPLAPATATQTPHTYANGELKHCSVCDEVCSGVGPVAECIHCPSGSYTVCIRCQDGLRSGDAQHEPDHVFKLVQPKPKRVSSLSYIRGAVARSSAPRARGQQQYGDERESLIRPADRATDEEEARRQEARRQKTEEALQVTGEVLKAIGTGICYIVKHIVVAAVVVAAAAVYGVGMLLVALSDA